MEKGRGRPVFFLAIGTLLWGSTFVVIRLLVRDMEPLSLVSWRFVVAAIFLAPMLLWSSHRRKLSPSLLTRGLLMGLVLFGGYFLQTAGLALTGAANSAFITSLYLIFTPLIARLTGMASQTRKLMLPVLLSLAGLALLTRPQAGVNQGDLLTLASALCWALHLVLIDRWSLEGSELELSIVQLVAVGLVALLTDFLVNGRPEVPSDLAEIGGILYLGIPATVLVLFWQLKWQKLLGASTSALIYVGEALVAALGAELLLREHLPLEAYLGAVLIVLAVVIRISRGRRDPARDLGDHP